MAYYQDPNQGYQQMPPQQQGYGQPPPQQQPYYGQQQPPPQQDGGVLGAPPTYSPSNGSGPAEGLVRQESTVAMKIEKDTNLMKRDVYPHANFDIDCLQDIPHLQDMKSGWQFKFETLLYTWILFNAVSTIMIILTNFKRQVPPATRAEYAGSYDSLMDFLIYFPLAYFGLIVLIFNNYYAEMSFYLYMRRGAIIDFPPSAKVKALFTSVVPLVFIIVTLAYAGVVVYAFIKFKATVGVIFIFINNVAIGIGLSWYRQQSIESKFVSISNFIQSFPNRDDVYGDMDEQSLHHAATFLTKLTLTEADTPSWTGYMRNFYWKNKQYPLWQQILHHCMVFIIIGVLIGLCLAYFIILRGLDLKSVWQNEINPCVTSCTTGIAIYNNSIQTPTTLTGWCQRCVCMCLNTLNQRDDDVVGKCGDFGSSHLCDQAGVTLCPGKCTW